MPGLRAPARAVPSRRHCPLETRGSPPTRHRSATPASRRASTS
jgi:hypothetical protein